MLGDVEFPCLGFCCTDVFLPPGWPCLVGHVKCYSCYSLWFFLLFCFYSYEVVCSKYFLLFDYDYFVMGSYHFLHLKFWLGYDWIFLVLLYYDVALWLSFSVSWFLGFDLKLWNPLFEHLVVSWVLLCQFALWLCD